MLSISISIFYSKCFCYYYLQPFMMSMCVCMNVCVVDVLDDLTNQLQLYYPVTQVSNVSF